MEEMERKLHRHGMTGHGKGALDLNLDSSDCTDLFICRLDTPHTLLHTRNLEMMFYIFLLETERRATVK